MLLHNDSTLLVIVIIIKVTGFLIGWIVYSISTWRGGCWDESTIQDFRVSKSTILCWFRLVSSLGYITDAHGVCACVRACVCVCVFVCVFVCVRGGGCWGWCEERNDRIFTIISYFLILSSMPVSVCLSVCLPVSVFLSLSLSISIILSFFSLYFFLIFSSSLSFSLSLCVSFSMSLFFSLFLYVSLSLSLSISVSLSLSLSLFSAPSLSLPLFT